MHLKCAILSLIKEIYGEQAYKWQRAVNPERIALFDTPSAQPIPRTNKRSHAKRY